MCLLLADFLAYWTHRVFHARWLWPFHAVHHSSTTVDWLSSVRLHPVNDVVARVVQVLPLYWMGFNAGALAAFVPFLTFYALVLHANVNWSFGPLRFIVASPVFHRWHHTSEEEGLDKNFAQSMVEDHKKDVEEAKTARDATDDPKLKKLLTTLLPTLEKHQETAQKIADAQK